MITRDKLRYFLSEIHDIQEENLGVAALSIVTGKGTFSFAVTVETDLAEDTFLFDAYMTEDQCLDKLTDIENMIKEEK